RRSVKMWTNYAGALFPSLYRRKEGWLRHPRNVAKPPKLTQAGVVFLSVLNRKTTPASRSADASRHFINRSASPPCGDARRGIRSIPIPAHLRGPPTVGSHIARTDRT